MLSLALTSCIQTPEQPACMQQAQLHCGYPPPPLHRHSFHCGPSRTPPLQTLLAGVYKSVLTALYAHRTVTARGARSVVFTTVLRAKSFLPTILKLRVQQAAIVVYSQQSIVQSLEFPSSGLDLNIPKGAISCFKVYNKMILLLREKPALIPGDQ